MGKRGTDYPITPAEARKIGTVYLLHFDTPYGHARHYTGWATDLIARLNHHASGHGGRLLQVVLANGIGWSLAKIWTDKDRYFERSLKNRGGASRHCPICQGRLTATQTMHFGPVSTGLAARAILSA
jgi:predicted GIY-YIG superfamily endonuclease